MFCLAFVRGAVARDALHRVFSLVVLATWCSEGSEKALHLLKLERCVNEVTVLKDIKTLISKVEGAKKQGNDAFNAKNYEMALSFYSRAMTALEGCPNAKLRVVLLANRVATLMAMERCVGS